jgi:type II secretory ATPase GspE/PulE/Tfp pilus assembly ATPase PilB-like protein
VDGLLRDALTIPHHLQDATLSRLKIMSGMDISERRKPQDGRSRLAARRRRIDLRVSTMPTQFGEKSSSGCSTPTRQSCRSIRSASSPENLRLVQSFLSNAQGMILVTGPTGSGKTRRSTPRSTRSSRRPTTSSRSRIRSRCRSPA